MRVHGSSFARSGIAAGLAALAIAVLGGCAGAPPRPVEVPASPAPAPGPASRPAGFPDAASPLAVVPPASSAASEPAKDSGDALALERGFARWVAAFRDAARAAGIDEATLSLGLDEVHYLPRVVELDRLQPEFGRTVWDYLDRTVTTRRVEQGREKLQQVRAEADAAAARYGVPPSTLMAVWAIESDYGRHVGDTPTLDALATLGFEGRREAWARGQLLAALKILQSGDIERDRMIGSWAGAMGQTQFLPSAFLAYAVDADNDGRRDIWDSVADVLASTANFLGRAGWQTAQRWGTEVVLPAGFDPGRADQSIRQATAAWAGEGVRAADGAPLPEFADGAILLPAGARGPAFLVGPGFRALLRYNASTSYALAVAPAGPANRRWSRRAGALAA